MPVKNFIFSFVGDFSSQSKICFIVQQQDFIFHTVCYLLSLSQFSHCSFYSNIIFHVLSRKSFIQKLKTSYGENFQCYQNLIETEREMNSGYSWSSEYVKLLELLCCIFSCSTIICLKGWWIKKILRSPWTFTVHVCLSVATPT